MYGQLRRDRKWLGATSTPVRLPLRSDGASPLHVLIEDGLRHLIRSTRCQRECQRLYGYRSSRRLK